MDLIQTIANANRVPGLNPARLVVVTAPAAEPITTAEAKTYLNVDQDAEDAMIGDLVTAARRLVEELTGRCLVNTVLRAEWDHLPRCGTYYGAPVSRELVLPKAPLVSVAWLKYTDEDGAEQTFAASNYTVETGLDPNRLSRLWLNDTADWPDLGSYPGALRAQFTAGHGAAASDVPAEIKVLIRQLVKLWYDPARDGVNIGNIVNDLPYSLRALIEMHQVRTII